MNEGFMERTWAEIRNVILPAQPDLQKILDEQK